MTGGIVPDSDWAVKGRPGTWGNEDSRRNDGGGSYFLKIIIIIITVIIILPVCQ